jgi:hypothetical protein
MRGKSLKLAFGLIVAASATARADDVRYYQENGVTYRESRYTIGHPVVETHLQPQQHTIYSQVPSSTTRDVVHTYHTPVTEYHSETYLKGRWNPFVKPYMAERIKPVTNWQMRTEVVKVPVQQQVLVPQTVTVHVPVTTHRVVNEEHISRVAVGGQGVPSLSPGSNPTAVAGSIPPAQPAGAITVGGVSNLEQDPPRVGSNYQWRPADTTRR